MLRFSLHINLIIFMPHCYFVLQGASEMVRNCYVGGQEYEKLIQSPCFVDKTLLIKEFLLQPEPSVHLVTEPYRFGKTVNMMMLKIFLEIPSSNYSGINSGCQLFITNNLNIFKDNETFFYDNCGQYPVIHISFKDIKGNNFEDVLHFLKNILDECFSQHKYLLESTELSKYQKIVIRKYFYNEPVPIIKLQNYILDGIRLLCQMLFHHFFRKTVILIEDFDAPIWSVIRGEFRGDIDDFLDFIVDFNKALLNNNLYLGKALINTGGRTSSVVSRYVRSIAHEHLCCNHPFVGYYGLTEDEVKEKLSQFNTLDMYEEVKAYYGGYTSGDLSSVYGLSSVIRFFETGSIGKYWTDSPGFNYLDKLFIHEGKFRNYLKMLLRGKEIKIKSDQNIKFYDILDISQIISGEETINDVQSELLLQLLSDKGYLTFRHKSNKSLLLRIPNEDTYQHLFHSVYSEPFISKNFNFSDDRIDTFLQSMDLLGTEENKTKSLLEFTETLTDLYRGTRVPGCKEELQSSLYHVMKKMRDHFLETNMEVTIRTSNMSIWKDNKRKRVKEKGIKKAVITRVDLVTIRKQDKCGIVIKTNLGLKTVKGRQQMMNQYHRYRKVFQTQLYKNVVKKNRIFVSIYLNYNTTTFSVRYLTDDVDLGEQLWV